MLFNRINIDDAWLIEPSPHHDERGYFARLYDEDMFAEHNIPVSWPQHNISYNSLCGTLRGMHFQLSPHDEPKIVRCTHGVIFDVIVDLRPNSSSYKKWSGHVLSSENLYALYVPSGCAHGFLTLKDNTIVSYLMGARYNGASAAGVRWNDPAFRIKWPSEPTLIAPRDSAWPDFIS